jgi:uncharacterized protein YkwD
MLTMKTHTSCMTCISLLAAIGLSLGGCADTTPAPQASAQPSFYRSLANSGASIDPAAARDMISIYRTNNNLPVLSIDPALQRAAKARAEEMVKAGSASPDSAAKLKARLASEGVVSGVAVENVSAGYHTLAEAFSGWRQSAPHNANMLNKSARRMGIATAYAPDSKYKVYWALVLAE